MASSDIFLRLKSLKGGPIKGESSDHSHKDDIELRSVSWGMRSSNAMGSDGAANKASFDAVSFTKWVDKSSTALMGVLRANDQVTEALFTVRKAGGAAALDYFQIKIKNGRLTSYDVSTDPEHRDRLIETVTVTFKAIDVQYKTQDGGGGSAGTSSFNAESV